MSLIPDFNAIGGDLTTFTIENKDDKRKQPQPQRKTQLQQRKTQEPQEKEDDDKAEQPFEQFSVLDTNKMNFEFDRYFLNWLSKINSSLIVCSYKSNAIFSMGCVPNKKSGNEMLSLWITNSMRPMGATYDEKNKRLWVGSCLQLLQYSHQGKKKSDREDLQDFDAYFVPRMTRTINDIDIHDVVLDSNGNPYFISALFGCVCVPSDSSSFKVYWSPPWLSKTAAEDRCHLNGLAIKDGVPRYVTSVSRTDIRAGWRDKRKNGGVIWDIVENKLICKNLSMPHSPRYNNGKLWVLNSGTGYFGYVDFDSKVTENNETYHPFVPMVFLPSYIRGLSFIDDKYAIIGGSQDRHDAVFQGLDLKDNLEKKGVSASICAIYVIDLESFDVVHQFEFKGEQVKELYDVTIIPNANRPLIAEMDFQNIATEFKIEV